MIDKEAHDPSREYEGNPRQRAQPGTLWPMRMSVRAFSLFWFCWIPFAQHIMRNITIPFTLDTRVQNADIDVYSRRTGPHISGSNISLFLILDFGKKANSHVWIRIIIVVHCFLCLCIGGHDPWVGDHPVFFYLLQCVPMVTWLTSHHIKASVVRWSNAIPRS